MSKILRDELVAVLGVSKNNANAFVDNLSKRYLIDLIPVGDLVDDVLDAPVGSDSVTEEDDVNFGQEQEQSEFMKELSNIDNGVEGNGPDGEKYSDQDSAQN